jgi:RimJ/RimL family protein N-acetyltransferase
VISVVVDSEKRGRGYGTELIKNGTDRYIQTTEVPRVDAYIKKDNEASVRAFEKAGYQFRKETTVKGDPSYCFSKYSKSEE